MTVSEVRKSLTGPIASIRTPFNRDGTIDFGGMRRLMDLAIEAGCGTSLLTAGDSHLQCLSDEEVSELLRQVVEHSAGRTMVVAADWQFATPQAVRFARYCRDVGADMLMHRPPDWARSCTAESLAEHFARVAENIPVMMVTNLFAARDASFGLAVVRMIRDRVDNVMAVKDDLRGDFAIQLCLLVHDSWAVFSGGSQRNHLSLWPFGCDGFMDRFMSFRPEVSLRYWKALCEGDLPSARALIRDVEIPLENDMNAFPGGRDAAIHGLFEIYGIAGRWRRPPYRSLTDEELGQLKGRVREMGLL